MAQKHEPDFCPCEACTKRLLEAHRAYMQKWLDAQERLGPECEKVLHDNLWELYAR